MAYGDRRVMTGYPINGRFETREELDQYFVGSRLTCLRCGKTYRILDTHLRAQHGMTSDEYREMYGIPYTRGLTPDERVAELSARMQEIHARSTDHAERNRAILAEAKKLLKGAKHRNKPVYWKRERTKHTEADWRRLGEKVMAGRILHECDDDGDTPPASGLDSAFRAFPDLYRWWMETVEPARVLPDVWKMRPDSRKAKAAKLSRSVPAMSGKKRNAECNENKALRTDLQSGA